MADRAGAEGAPVMPGGASCSPPAKRNRRRRQLVVRGDLRVPPELMPWERDLLLPTVLKTLAELFPAPGEGEKK